MGSVGCVDGYMEVSFGVKSRCLGRRASARGVFVHSLCDGFGVDDDNYLEV